MHVNTLTHKHVRTILHNKIAILKHTLATVVHGCLHRFPFIQSNSDTISIYSLSFNISTFKLGPTEVVTKLLFTIAIHQSAKD